jgi:hypothetical protein
MKWQESTYENSKVTGVLQAEVTGTKRINEIECFVLKYRRVSGEKNGDVLESFVAVTPDGCFGAGCKKEGEVETNVKAPVFFLRFPVDRRYEWKQPGTDKYVPVMYEQRMDKVDYDGRETPAVCVTTELGGDAAIAHRTDKSWYVAGKGIVKATVFIKGKPIRSVLYGPVPKGQLELVSVTLEKQLKADVIKELPPKVVPPGVSEVVEDTVRIKHAVTISQGWKAEAGVKGTLSAGWASVEADVRAGIEKSTSKTYERETERKRSVTLTGTATGVKLVVQTVQYSRVGIAKIRVDGVEMDVPIEFPEDFGLQAVEKKD